ncbi:unnamed protein product [Didymodactylos carnosus]|uniref:Plasmid stabilization protein n=2 Tax=Didymodactylos carnosus TaxID=1234261 RepID=A0A8S2JZN3_9BILA|nr:unnamed protein product [Didymodactylos carnosus]CAF3829145.1 unnamed protein product [Didymodactylos carnosus]
MPVGDKSKYSDKQKRQAKHILDSEMSSGKDEKTASRIAYATVNKIHGGGNISGSGRDQEENKEPMQRGGRKGGSQSRKRGSSSTSATRSKKSSSKSQIVTKSDEADNTKEEPSVSTKRGRGRPKKTTKGGNVSAKKPSKGKKSTKRLNRTASKKRTIK